MNRPTNPGSGGGGVGRAELSREIAGIRCSQVLERLSDYLDGELSELETGRIVAHLAECDRCERFGGRFYAVLEGLKRQLGASEGLAPDVAMRLRERLRSEDREK